MNALFFGAIIGLFNRLAATRKPLDILLAVVLSVAYQPATAVTVDVDLANGPANTVIPAQALGAAVDGHSRGDSAAIFRPATLAAMRSVGLRPLSYRLRTELGIAVWHWNPCGRWSEPAHTRGYWISDSRPRRPIAVSYGYRLPRRGNTLDQAENDGYSRLADGDLATFWKSNPYLDRRYTGEDNARHPQWVIADLGQRTPVDAIRIAWGIPYATRYQVQYWEGEDPRDPDEYPPGGWRDFADAAALEGRGGEVTLRLAPAPVSVRFVRILMSATADIAPVGSSDVRDGLGYAIREIYIGTLRADGGLRDAVRHGVSRHTQTLFFVSSTDPWHRAVDLDPTIEQPGIDRVFTSGLTHGLPLLLPVGVLYDTPDNGANLLRYLRRRGYPVQRVEMGEEPDGQYVAPEDYGALYVQIADALRAVDPQLELGGPAFQSLDPDPMMAWAGYNGVENRSWLTRLLAYLSGRGRDLAFVSFEWYPFDDICAPPSPHLLQGPQLLTEALDDLRKQGLPASVPLLMTEYGYSAFDTQAEVDLTGALFNADVVGTFLALGGSTAYLYGYEPSALEKGRGCDTWGKNTLFLSDDQRRIKARTATYHGARLLARQWLGAADQPHRVYPARADATAADGVALISAYAIQRPDGLWSLLLINKDAQQNWTVRVRFTGTAGDGEEFLRGPADLYQFSTAQYAWKQAGEHGRPLRSHSPVHTRLSDPNVITVRLPAWSLSVVRGRGPVPVGTTNGN